VYSEETWLHNGQDFFMVQASVMVQMSVDKYHSDDIISIQARVTN